MMAYLVLWERTEAFDISFIADSSLGPEYFVQAPSDFMYEFHAGNPDFHFPLQQTRHGVGKTSLRVINEEIEKLGYKYDDIYGDYYYSTPEEEAKRKIQKQADMMGQKTGKTYKLYPGSKK